MEDRLESWNVDGEIAKRDRTGDCVKNEGEECVCESMSCVGRRI